ncbi:MAG TPA: xanthine dehydrogenase family protein molybdopterin-binding subunit [Chloroflexota bacterium]|jgi:carbon-monoxide dehydrogenase large subunit
MTDGTTNGQSNGQTQGSGFLRYIGASVHRVEDQRILRGRGHYIDDLKLPGMLHAAFVRSPHAHARITRIETSAAKALPGVVAVFTAPDIEAVTDPLANQPMPGHKSPSIYGLTGDKVRLVGDVVAIVIAESRYLAEDGCDLVEVEYEPLEAVSTIAQALAPSSPPIFDDLGDNVAIDFPQTFGDVDGAFAKADRVIKHTFHQHRYAHVPMEGRGGVADYDPGTGNLTYHTANQAPQVFRMVLSHALRVPVHQLRVVNSQDIGGAFGSKAQVYREDLAILAASKILGRPVKWVEDRRENLTASGQAREDDVTVEAAVKNDGTLLGLRIDLVMNQGAYPTPPNTAITFGFFARALLPGAYRLKALGVRLRTVFSNKASYVPYRGPWAVETWVRERVLDIIARDLGLDPIDVRRRNLLEPGDLPTSMVTGPDISQMTQRQTMDHALERIGYSAFREEQRRARAEGRLLGIGVANLMEFAPGPANFFPSALGAPSAIPEQARVRLEIDGHVTVFTAQAPHGQSHETTLAQITADEIGVPLESVRVVHGDTGSSPFSLIGTGGSRGSNVAVGATRFAARRVRDKVLRIAAGMLEVSADDLEIVAGLVRVKGAPDKLVPLGGVATVAYMAPHMLPKGDEMGVEETSSYDGGNGGGWAYATHACIVEVDAETGQAAIKRYVVAEDCGDLINPAIVDGQIRGGIAQGVGAVLLEQSTYGDDGQFMAATFMDYLLPTSVEVPPIEIEHLEIPNGDEIPFRGVGEGGAIAAPPAVNSAIEDALSQSEVRITEQYLPPSRILELVGAIQPES